MVSLTGPPRKKLKVDGKKSSEDPQKGVRAAKRSSLQVKRKKIVRNVGNIDNSAAEDSPKKSSEVPQEGLDAEKDLSLQAKRKTKRQNIKTADKNAKEESLNNNRKQNVDWKELKKRKKALKETRKQKKFSAEEIVKNTKRLYEIARKKSLPKSEKRKMISKIYKRLRGHLKEIIYKHDMTRVAQLLFKFSSKADRKSIWSELKPEVSKMIVSKYAVHTVKSLLEFGNPKIRKELTASIKGNLLTFLKNQTSSLLIDLVYKNYASSEDKSLMRQELTHFTTNTMSTLIETVERKGCFSLYSSESLYIHNLVEGAKEEEDSYVMISAKAILQMLIEKDVVGNSLVQSVLSDYLMKCSPTDREQFLSNLQPVLETILDSGLNSLYAVMLFAEYLWFGSNKDKKWLVKKLHLKMPQVCFKDYSYFLIMIVFECVDDTVLLKKTLLKDIIENMKQFADNTWGWKVLMHILTPRNPRHFSTSYVTLLKVGDKIAKKKKSDAVRNAEILNAVSDPLVEDIAAAIPYWISTGPQAIVTKEALCVTQGPQLVNIFDKIADFICCEKPELLDVNNSEFNRQIEWLIKQLIKTDSRRYENDEVTFSSFFLSKVTEENMKLWFPGKSGVFLFLKLMETEIPTIQKKVQHWVKTTVIDVIGDDPVSELLLKKINELQEKFLLH